MAETKWTPGEWRVDTLGIGTPWTIDTQDENIALAAQVVGDDQKQTRRKANAHLIAAAPDLYAVVADLIDFLEERGCACQPDYSPCVLCAAQAAMKKARGEA